jgi:hypothetical protein
MSSYTTAHYVKLDLTTNQILLKSSFGYEFRNGFQNSKLSSMHEVSRRRVLGEEDELTILKVIPACLAFSSKINSSDTKSILLETTIPSFCGEVNRFWSFTDLLFWVYGFPVAVLFCCGQ